MEPRVGSTRTSDGVTIAYADAGSPRAPALVLLPGVPFSNVLVEWQIEVIRDAYAELSERLRLVAFDGRGTGHSQRDVRDLSLDAMLLDLDAVVRAAGLERFALLGFYNSCTHAIAYAARHPGRVSHLILFGGGARGWYSMSPPETQALLTLIERDWDLFVESAAHLWMGWSLADAGRLETEVFRTATTPSVARATLEAAAAIDVSAEVPLVRAPALVLHREGVHAIPAEIPRQLAAALPNGRLRMLAGTSATLFHERAGEVVDAILSFVLGDALSRPSARPRPDAPARLTPREIDVLRLIAAGETNKEIARRLGLSVHTIERHAANLYRKIDARGRADATAFALRRGIG